MQTLVPLYKLMICIQKQAMSRQFSLVWSENRITQIFGADKSVEILGSLTLRFALRHYGRPTKLCSDIFVNMLRK